MEKPTFAVGQRVDKFCKICDEERGHVVASVTKRGQVSRVECPKCSTRSAYKLSDRQKGDGDGDAPTGIPYERTRTYRTGQTIMHPTYGAGEVTALIEPQKIDVLFTDRMRRLIHNRV